MKINIQNLFIYFCSGIITALFYTLPAKSTNVTVSSIADLQIELAGTSDTIYVTPSASTYVITSSFSIFRSVSIIGKPAGGLEVIIQATGNFRHFSYNGAYNVELGSLVLIGPNTNYTTGVFTPTTPMTDGGGIFAQSGNLRVSNCKIAGCQSPANGGAILANTNPLSVNNSVFQFNNARGSGGAVSLSYNTSLTLEDVTIQSNKAGFDTISQTVSVAGGGGGIEAGGDCTMSGNIILENNEAYGDGGALFKHIYGNFDLTGLTLFVLRGNFTHTGDGGGICAYTALTLDNSNGIMTLSGNNAGRSGGAVQSRSTLTLKDVIFANNKAGYNPDIATVSNPGIGGAIDARAALFLQGDVTFNGNEAYRDGGAICKDGNGVFDVSGISSLKIQNNITYVGSGGGIYTAAALMLDNTMPSNIVLSPNTAGAHGGAIAALASLTLKNITISDCKAGYNPNTGLISQGGNGGAVYATNALTLEGDIVFQNNQAYSNGGAIYKGTTGNFDVNGVTSLTIKDNATYTASGGGICTYATLTLDNTSNNLVLSPNTAGAHGGAIVAFAPLTLKNTIIADCNAGYNPDTGLLSQAGSGGAVYANSQTTFFGNIVFENNSANSDGGAICFPSGANLDASTNINTLTAKNNKANGRGGAIIAFGTTEMNISNATFEDNMALSAGGAIYAYGQLSLSYSTFQHNVSSNNGGGLYKDYSYTFPLDIKKCTFFNNSALNGGGIFTGESTSNTISNSTFSQNTATARGGAFYSSVNNASVNIVLNTFNGNTATSGAPAIYFINATGKLLNGNIIYGNGTGTEITPTTGISGNYNLIRGTSSPFSGDGNLLVEANRVQEIFTDFLSGDSVSLKNNGGPTQTLNILRNGLAYNLIPKNSNWLSGINDDQTGSDRVRGCNVDAGSVELQVIDPSFSKWISAGNASDWNDPDNWENRDNAGNLITDAAIPSACTNVVIPENTTTYPVLQEAGTVLAPDKAYARAVCDTITFNFGGEVAKTHYLDYNFAKVDLTLQSGQWYILSPTLQQQYSGDYLEDGSQYRINPEISIMYYQTGNPQTGTGKVESKFTGLFNNTDELLNITTGHAIWVDEGNRPESDFTIHFPKDSTQYCYYAIEDNHVTRISGTMERDKRGRFIYEGNTSYLSNEDGTFTQIIENSNDFPQVIIGNPYMSHFDMVEFQKQNSTYLSQSFRIWKGGTSYETYQINNDGSITGTDPDYQVSPMQSVIIDTKMQFSDPLLFTPVMSITQPGTILRSISRTLAQDVLRVEILRQGVRQSGIALRHQTNASRHYDKTKDVWTIIPKNVGSYVSLYSLVDGGAASIYTTGDIETPIDLGISVGNTIKKSINNGQTEIYTIRIAPDTESRLTDKDIYLFDSKYNMTYNLTESDYDFENTTGDITGRFQLFAKAKDITGIEDAIYDHPIGIIYANKQIRVTSSSDDPILEISVFNLLGEQLYGISNLSVSDWSFNLSAENFIIVKVKTAKSIKTKKMIIK